MRYLLILILLTMFTCEPVFAGYTLFTRPLISPQYIVVHGAFQDESRLNPGPQVTYPATFSQMICKSASFSAYSTSASRRVEVWEDSAGTASDAQVLSACPLKSDISDEIKTIRAKGLELSTKNSGVLAVYSENYAAAVACLAGSCDSTIMKNGLTASQYLGGFGTRLGMTVNQFATYIVAENRKVGPAAYQIEDEYLRLAYSVIPAETSVSRLLAYPIDYRRFCGL
jgi:hypothetical protein